MHDNYETHSTDYFPQPPRRKRRRRPSTGRNGNGGGRARRKFDHADPTWDAVLRSIRTSHEFSAVLADGSRVTFRPAQILALAKVADRLVTQYTRSELVALLRGVA